MSFRTDGSIFIFSSPSGAGKTTIVKLVSKKKNFITSVSHTTRKPRSNEVDGKDYYFVTKRKFQELINKKEFLEHAKVFNNLYGTVKKPVFKNLSAGKNVLFDIDWQGSKQIKTQNIDFNIFSFFVLPPSRKVLYERLSNRDMKDKLIVSERMKEFYSDIKHWVDYDYVVINDDLNRCFKEISKIIDNVILSKKVIFDKLTIKKHIKKLIS
ncbi:guanylate kinase [Candidatus Pelagibacter sp.]|nr:guanylate kinase [Candidatus Pelagibacter sp.]